MTARTSLPKRPLPTPRPPMRAWLPALAWLLALAFPGKDAHAISRTEVMVRARAYAYHPWHCSSANLTAWCDGTYQSDYFPGDYMGLPYDWGGYKTLFQFDQEIDQGYGAGSPVGGSILSCTTGVDCSGYVSKCWNAGHTTTSGMDQISYAIQPSQVLPGDAFNDPGYHVVLFSHTLGTGEPVFYESSPPNVHINTYGGWSYVNGYTPIRYNNITGTSASNPLGTPDNPILIGSLPYTDTGRDTSQSASDVLDGCGAEPGTDESGPEYVYRVNITQPGQLTVGVQDGQGVDIDVHLYTSMNTSDCIARAHISFTHPVDCGTYYIVADTYMSYAGPYDLTVSLSPSGQPCGSGPPQYDFVGDLGDPCANPNNYNLPPCNPNLGSEVCIYTSSTSFCSKSCQTNADCSADFPGGCCDDLGANEYYCLTSSLCPATGPDAGVPGSDGSVVWPDGSVPGSDGSAQWPDGYLPRSDGRSQNADGGLQNADGGFNPPAGSNGSGCACRSAGHTETHGLPFGAAIVWLILAPLLWRRSKKARTRTC